MDVINRSTWIPKLMFQNQLCRYRVCLTRSFVESVGLLVRAISKKACSIEHGFGDVYHRGSWMQRKNPMTLKQLHTTRQSDGDEEDFENWNLVNISSSLTALRLVSKHATITLICVIESIGTQRFDRTYTRDRIRMKRRGNF